MAATWSSLLLQTPPNNPLKWEPSIISLQSPSPLFQIRRSHLGTYTHGRSTVITLTSKLDNNNNNKLITNPVINCVGKNSFNYSGGSVGEEKEDGGDAFEEYLSHVFDGLLISMKEISKSGIKGIQNEAAFDEFFHPFLAAAKTSRRSRRQPTVDALHTVLKKIVKFFSLLQKGMPSAMRDELESPLFKILPILIFAMEHIPMAKSSFVSVMSTSSSNYSEGSFPEEKGFEEFLLGVLDGQLTSIKNSKTYSAGRDKAEAIFYEFFDIHTSTKTTLEGSTRKLTVNTLLEKIKTLNKDELAEWLALISALGGPIAESSFPSWLSSLSFSYRRSYSSTNNSNSEGDVPPKIFTYSSFLLDLVINATESEIRNISKSNCSVVKLQVGLSGMGISLQNDLNRIAETADTSNSTGWKYILTETIQSLVQHLDYCISSYLSVDVKQSIEDGEECLKNYAGEERIKFDEETLVNVNSVKKKVTSINGKNECITKYLVITILVAGEGELQLPTIKDCKDLEEAMQQLTFIPNTKLKGVEVLWAPQQENDTLSETDLRFFFSNLRPLRK